MCLSLRFISSLLLSSDKKLFCICASQFLVFCPRKLSANLWKRKLEQRERDVVSFQYNVVWVSYGCLPLLCNWCCSNLFCKAVSTLLSCRMLIFGKGTHICIDRYTYIRTYLQNSNYYKSGWQPVGNIHGPVPSLATLYTEFIIHILVPHKLRVLPCYIDVFLACTESEPLIG